MRSEEGSWAAEKTAERFPGRDQLVRLTMKGAEMVLMILAGVFLLKHWYITVMIVIVALALEKWRQRIDAEKPPAAQSGPLADVKSFTAEVDPSRLVRDAPDLPSAFIAPQSREGADFILRREALKATFPAAYGFLCQPHGFRKNAVWISTAVNAHLYYDDTFLAYIKIRPTSLVFSSRYNVKIVTGTKDASGLLFPEKFRGLIKTYDGFGAHWASEDPDGTFEIFSQAPEEYFRDLAHALKSYWPIES